MVGERGRSRTCIIEEVGSELQRCGEEMSWGEK